MKTQFNFLEVQNAVKNTKSKEIAFVHDDGTYLLIDEKVIRPIRGGLKAGEGDDFVEYIPIEDIKSIPKIAIDLIINITETNFSIAYTINQKAKLN